MSDTKSQGFLSPLVARLFRPLGPRSSQVVFLLIAVLVAAIGGRALWQRYGDQILNRQDFVLTANQIEVTPLPPWIKVDVKSEAVVAGSLEGMSLTQSDLTVRVADAFAMHPWVAKVICTQKRYGRVLVDLQYRRPIAMVWVWDPDPGLYPIDAQAVLLPVGDFTSQQAREDYLQVEIYDAQPKDRMAGSAWGDARVHGAARIADALADHWKKLGLERIVVESDHPNATATFQLRTRGGATIPWGNAPGQESTGEPSTQAKVNLLLSRAEEKGSLDESLPNLPLDLRIPALPPLARRVES